ncbi:hypothetical protein Naga_102273g1, partial [Nannochloropsis gaditana]
MEVVMRREKGRVSGRNGRGGGDEEGGKKRVAKGWSGVEPRRDGRESRDRGVGRANGGRERRREGGREGRREGRRKGRYKETLRAELCNKEVCRPYLALTLSGHAPRDQNELKMEHLPPQFPALPPPPP